MKDFITVTVTFPVTLRAVYRYHNGFFMIIGSQKTHSHVSRSSFCEHNRGRVDSFTATNEMVGLYMAEKNIGSIFPLTNG